MMCHRPSVHQIWIRVMLVRPRACPSRSETQLCVPLEKGVPLSVSDVEQATSFSD